MYVPTQRFLFLAIYHGRFTCRYKLVFKRRDLIKRKYESEETDSKTSIIQVSRFVTLLETSLQVILNLLVCFSDPFAAILTLFALEAGLSRPAHGHWRGLHSKKDNESLEACHSRDVVVELKVERW